MTRRKQCLNEFQTLNTLMNQQFIDNEFCAVYLIEIFLKQIREIDLNSLNFRFFKIVHIKICYNFSKINDLIDANNFVSTITIYF